MNIKHSEKYTLRLTSLHQYYTYTGVILGTPNAERNQAHINKAMAEAAERMNTPAVRLIKPTQIYITHGFLGNPHRINDMQKHCEGTQSEEPMMDIGGEPMQRLPIVTCFGTFVSVARNENEDFSDMTLVWYQDSLVGSIDPVVVKQIKQLDWEALAQAYDF